MQVARVRSPFMAGPTISVVKVALFCNPVSGTRSQALLLRLDKGKKKSVAKAKVFLYLEARVRVGRGIPHSKDSLSLLRFSIQKIHALDKIGAGNEKTNERARHCCC
jgi:hypothetical protein